VKSRDRNCGYEKSDQDFAKCLIQQTTYRQEFLSEEKRELPNGIQIAPSLFHEDTEGIYDITILYPRAEGDTPQPISTFNNLVKSIAFSRQDLQGLRTPNGLSVPNTHSANYKLEIIGDSLVSLLFSSYTYAGGAHGGSDRYAILFDLAVGHKFEMSDLLVNVPQAVTGITELCKEGLRNKAAREGWGNVLWFDDPVMQADPVKEVRDIRNWLIHTSKVEILFGEYTIAPYSAGVHGMRFNRSTAVEMDKSSRTTGYADQGRKQISSKSPGR
jgi:hypothetical protein